MRGDTLCAEIFSIFRALLLRYYGSHEKYKSCLSLVYVVGTWITHVYATLRDVGLSTCHRQPPVIPRH